MSTAKIELLAGWLERQLADNTISDGRIWQEMTVSERTFYRLKPKATALLNTRLQERQKIVEATRTQETVAAALNGLKTKNERVLLYQKLVDEALLDLGGKKLDVYEKVALRKNIKDLQAEISKIEGDYAPDKVEDVTQKSKIDDLSFEELYLLKYGKHPKGKH